MIKVNLVDELLKERNKDISSADLLYLIKNIWSNSKSYENSINDKLNRKNSNEFNQLDFDKMETKNIFHKNTIKKISIKFRLRFLDSQLFKGDYPQNITNIISNLEKTHKTKLNNFMIMAPSKLFNIPP